MTPPAVRTFSFNHFCRSPWYGLTPQLPQTIDSCARAGFDLIGLDHDSLRAWEALGKTLAMLTMLLRDAGISAGPLVACAMLDGSAQALEQLATSARMAGELGVHTLQVNVTGPDREARCQAVEAACGLMPEGAKLRLAIEFLPFSGLATLAETLAIVAQVGSDRAGAMIDVWHLSHDPNGWAALETAPLDAIAYVELDDALKPVSDDLLAETMDRRTFPGEGVLDTRRFAEVLRGRGYDGLVSVEILSRALMTQPIDIFAAKALSSARAILG